MSDAAAGIAGFFLIFMLIEWAIVIIACMIVGKEKNRNGFLWGFFLNLIGLIVIAVLPPLAPKQNAVPVSRISNQGEGKPPIKIGWFLLYFLLIFFVSSMLMTVVLLAVFGSKLNEDVLAFYPFISIIVAVYFASKLSRK